MWIICIKFRYFSRKLLLALVTLSSYAFFKLNHKFWNNFNNKANPIFSCIISYSTEGCTLHICEAYCIFRIPPQKRAGKVHFPPINYFFLPPPSAPPVFPHLIRFALLLLFVKIAPCFCSQKKPSHLSPAGIVGEHIFFGQGKPNVGCCQLCLWREKHFSRWAVIVFFLPFMWEAEKDQTSWLRKLSGIFRVCGHSQPSAFRRKVSCLPTCMKLYVGTVLLFFMWYLVLPGRAGHRWNYCGTLLFGKCVAE